MISARALKKCFADGTGGELPVLNGVDLEVKRAEFVAILGPSGSGKSTLLHVLGGLDIHYQGEVQVAGVKLAALDDKGLARFRNREIGFVFQSFHLIPNLTAIENVLLPAYFDPRSINGEHRHRAEEVLSRVGMIGKKDRVPAQLSGGERQRVAIARALFARPKVLFCDEPTGNLDSVTGREVIDLFRALHQEGLTVLVVTHEERMSAAAQRILRLRDGRLADELDPEMRE